MSLFCMGCNIWERTEHTHMCLDLDCCISRDTRKERKNLKEWNYKEGTEHSMETRNDQPSKYSLWLICCINEEKIKT